MTATGGRRGTTAERRLRVACVQMNTREDVAENVRVAGELVDEAGARGAGLIVLPETWTYKGRRDGMAPAAEAPDGPSNRAVAAIAAGHGAWLLAGSIYEPGPALGRLWNTSVLFAPDGRLVAVYRKVHLFDAVSGAMVYRESDDLEAGTEAVTATADGVTLGLAICYDLRFPELFRTLALRGARLLAVPAAFTVHTGAAHWHVLIRARAIENTCFVAAAGQIGEHLPGRASYGHSMIVDPWGEVLTELEDGIGICVADLDLDRVDAVRAQIPSLANRCPEAYEL